MSAVEQDRALHAVRRVRDVRETDSRQGLRLARAATEARAAELDAARARRVSAAGFTAGSPTDFARHVAHVTALVGLEAQALERVESSRLVTDEAQRRWQHDREQVRVVDLLLDRRAEVRAEERRRAEAAQLDDLATQAWLRARSADATEGVTA